MASVLLSLLAAYLLGSFPSAMLVGRLKGRSIFEVGSGNMGAMNTARNLGVGPGALVLLLDLLKGAAAILVAGTISSTLNASPAITGWSLAAAGVAVAAGHAWSLFARFRGGKALAVTLGMLLPHYLLAGVIGVIIIIVLSLLLAQKELAAIVSVFLLVPLTAGAGWWQGIALQQLLPFCLAMLLVALIVTRKYVTANARTAPFPPQSTKA